jgi:DNA polymerase/3'-5' exonuclease PolX
MISNQLKEEIHELQEILNPYCLRFEVIDIDEKIVIEKTIEETDILIIPYDIISFLNFLRQEVDLWLSGENKFIIKTNRANLNFYFTDYDNWYSMLNFLSCSRRYVEILKLKSNRGIFKLSKDGLYNSDKSVVTLKEKEIFKKLKLLFNIKE